MTDQWDAVIIGAGAAGLTAGVVLARARFSVLIVDAGAPRNAVAAHMHGFLSRDGMAPAEFLDTGEAEFTGYGGQLRRTTVADAVRRPHGGFGLVLEPGHTIEARAVLVATGLRDELPDIPGLAEHWADSVHHCPHCHGYEVRDHSIAVVGTASAAVATHLAGLLRRHSPEVSFVRDGVELDAVARDRLTANGVTIVDDSATAIATVDGRLTGVELAGGGTLACDTVFVAPTPRPRDEVLAALGCARDPGTGLIAVAPSGATDIAGVWAAGNVVDPRAQVVTAAGAASVAAIAMTAWLLDQDLTRALEGDNP